MGIRRRLRERLLREVRVFGLRAPAEVQADDAGTLRLELGDDADRALVEGFATAATAMFGIDGRRRFWSGREAETAGAGSADADAFVRALGLREEASGTFRKGLDDDARDRLTAFAQGVNAWIDAGLWPRDERWAARDTQPRLWGAADSVLLAVAPARIGAAADAFHVEPGVAVPDELAAWWGRLRGAASRPEAVRAGPSEVEVPPPAGGGAPALTALTSGDLPRLRTREFDLSVRGEDPRRGRVRYGPPGVVISDLWGAPDDAAVLWRWGDGPDAAAASAFPAPDEELDRRCRAVPRTRLVPLEGGH